MKRTCTFLIAFVFLSPAGLPAAELHVSPSGVDAHPGTADKPLASVAAAQRAARALARREPVTVLLHDGVYYLPETLVLTAADSGMTYAAAAKARPVLSGGAKLTLRWTALGGGVYQAQTPPGLTMDQLFVGGQRQPMARYPNYDPAARQFNGAAADALSPERVARWGSPAGGYIHAMHAALWGDMHWRILGKRADGALDYEGGWQNNRPSPMHKQFRMVENLREELDAPGEWFHDARAATLYFFPPAGADLQSAVVEVVRLRHLVEFKGSRAKPVRRVTLRGLTFRHAARTFMENREPLLRSDWTTYRGGAVLLENAEDATIDDCDFDQLGGNSIFVSNYNRRVTVRGCLIRESGANGVALVGDPRAVRNAAFNYKAPVDYDRLDRTPGPQGDNFPADCLVDDCLITRSGRIEKQTAPVQIAMAQGITVRHCSIYDVPRAGINIGDGCWGGHVVEHCDVFDTVLETGDHGSFNSWGRDRYWHPDVRIVSQQVAADPALPLLDAQRPNVLRNTRWRCDHGWDIDLDDGSSNFRIHQNLLLGGGLKLREGYARTAANNVIVNNSLHPHVWYAHSGDVFTRNIVMGAYRPARMDAAKWGREVDRNLFTTIEADRAKFADRGCDANSLVGDPRFVDPARGDFRVRDDSPALQLGFVNFPMDQFGVRSPRLRAMARTPAIPALRAASETSASAGAELSWRGARVRDLVHYEFSAVGVAADAGGALLTDVAASSAAHALGLRKGDLMQRINGRAVRSVKELLEIAKTLPSGAPLTVEVIRHQQPQTLKSPGNRSLSVYRSFEEMVRADDARLAPVRAVTRGPKAHWFGYYDKFQLDPTGRYLLAMEVGFEHRLPEPGEAVAIGMVDLAHGDKWIELGQSRAWSWQQGCMLQWRPGADHEVLWNDREADRFVCRVLNVKTRVLRTLPRAIGHISPDGKTAVCEDFSRVWNFRAGYGYAGIPDRFADQTAPAEIGVWRMDMQTGESRLLVSVADLVKIPYPQQAPDDKHYVNHLSWGPNGKRLLLFNRWSGPGQPTRVFTIGADGRDLRLLSAHGASHWTWRDPRHVLIWSEGAYRLYADDGSGEPKETLWQAINGHQTYLPGTRDQWLVADTYPYGKKREQIVYLFHVPTGSFVPLGRFPSTYRGEWRCDSHPRVSRDGKFVIIDSPHGGNGRQQYLIDIGAIVREASPAPSINHATSRDY